MKTLMKFKEVMSFNLLYCIAIRIIYAAMFAYYVSAIIEESFIIQFMYISFFAIVSVAFDFFSANKKQLAEIDIKDNRIILTGVTIDLSQVSKILYSQKKRFEHTIRFKYLNDTYQDFELSDRNLIEDLRFYLFLVKNELPVKMLDFEDDSLI